MNDMNSENKDKIKADIYLLKKDTERMLQIISDAQKAAKTKTKEGQEEAARIIYEAQIIAQDLIKRLDNYSE